MKFMNKELIDGLMKIGLSNAETQVYCALLRLGEAKSGEIIKLSSVSASNVHDACEKLLKKGLISTVIKNKVKHYYPVEPESLQLLLEKEALLVKEKESVLKKILPEIKSMKQLVEKHQTAEVFLGLNGIKSAYKKLFALKEKKEEYVFFYKHDEINVDVVHKFFAKMDIEDYYKSIPTKALFSKEYETLFKKRKEKNTIKAKFTTLPIPSSINVYGNKTLIISWTEHPVAFLIESREIAQTNKDLFNEVWDKTK